MDYWPEFSPDGHWLAFARGQGLSDETICVVPVDGGETGGLTRLFSPDSLKMGDIFWSIGGLTWTSDSREIVFSAGDVYSPSLWRVASTAGDPRQIFQLPGKGLYSPHISGGHLIYSQLTAIPPDIWQFRLTGPQKGSQINLIESAQEEIHPDISPDGKRIAFLSSLSGEHELWTCEVEKCNSPQDWLQLTDNEWATRPCWSPDGEWIAFNSFQFAIHLIHPNGSEEHPVTQRGTRSPSWSSDGNWIYFHTREEGIFKIRIEAGEPKGEPVFVVGEGINPVESTDGRFLYFWKPAGKDVSASDDEGTLHRFSFESGQDTPILDKVVIAGWDVAKKGIYFFSSQTERFEFFDFQSGETSQLGPASFQIRRGLHSDRSISVAPGEDWLIYEGLDFPMDVMLVENFQ